MRQFQQAVGGMGRTDDFDMRVNAQLLNTNAWQNQEMGGHGGMFFKYQQPQH